MGRVDYLLDGQKEIFWGNKSRAVLHCLLLCRTSCVGTLLFAMHPFFLFFFSDAQSSVRKASATCLLVVGLWWKWGRWRWWRDLGMRMW